MKRIMCICLLLCFLLLPDMNLKAASASMPELNSADLEEFLDTIITEQMDELHIPNLTIAVVSAGEVILAKGYGYAHIEQGRVVDPHKTMFRIGSTSKLFTWTAVMQLVEQGKLDLDIDVNEYLDFEIPSVLEYGRRGIELEPITLRHLMTHTPGFEDYPSGAFSLSKEDVLPLKRYVRESRPARVFPPGDVTAYSNYGTVLAGYIVELISGIPYAQYIEENIYKPLGIENSTFRQPLPTHLAENMSKPYRYLDGEFREGQFEYMQEPSGSMSSSASDMAKFMLAYLQGGQKDGNRILMDDTVNIMFKEQFTHHPLLDGMAHGFIKATFNGQEIFHHPGGTMLYDTGLYLLPHEEVGLFISHSGGNYLVNIEIFQQFMDRYFPGERIAAPDAPADMAERANKYTGEYHQNRRTLTNVDKFLSLMMGVIHVSTTEEGYLEVTHLGETNKFVEIEPGVYQNLREGRTHDYGGDFRTIVFSTDPMGKIMLMTDGPMSYSRAVWYETFGITFLQLVLAIVFIVGSLLYRGVKAIALRLRKKPVQPGNEAKAAYWAKRVAVIQGLFTFAFLIQFISESEPDPLYGLPTSAFTEPSSVMKFFDLFVAYGIVSLSLVIAVFTILVWWKSYWKLAGRIHYTLFALAGIILTWIFFFWQVI